MPDISVLMLTYNKSPFLQRAVPVVLNSMALIEHAEILLLDNGSTDDSKAVISTLQEDYPLNVFTLPENIGLNGYSYLAERAKGSIIFTADDDVFEATYGWDEMFISLLNSKFSGRSFGYLGSDATNDNGGRQPHIWGRARLDDFEIEIAPVGGWLAATTRKIMDRVGGFHSDMPKMHLDDLDYQNRVWAAGYLCGVVKNIQVFHACAPRWYKELGREATYEEKMANLQEAGIQSWVQAQQEK